MQYRTELHPTSGFRRHQHPRLDPLIVNRDMEREFGTREKVCRNRSNPCRFTVTFRSGNKSISYLLLYFLSLHHCCRVHSLTRSLLSGAIALSSCGSTITLSNPSRPPLSRQHQASGHLPPRLKYDEICHSHDFTEPRIIKRSSPRYPGKLKHAPVFGFLVPVLSSLAFPYAFACTKQPHQVPF